jgi:hypothetical protein
MTDTFATPHFTDRLAHLPVLVLAYFQGEPTLPRSRPMEYLMSLTIALTVRRPTLPYYVALTKQTWTPPPSSSARIPMPAPGPGNGESRLHDGASSCIESYVVSRMLSEGPKVFTFDALTCEALENFDLTESTADYLQPFPSVSLR